MCLVGIICDAMICRFTTRLLGFCCAGWTNEGSGKTWRVWDVRPVRLLVRGNRLFKPDRSCGLRRPCKRGQTEQTHPQLLGHAPNHASQMPAAVQTPTAVVIDSVFSRPSIERGIDASLESHRLFYAPSSLMQQRRNKSQERIRGAQHAQLEARKAMFTSVFSSFKAE